MKTAYRVKSEQILEKEDEIKTMEEKLISDIPTDNKIYYITEVENDVFALKESRG